MQMIDLSRCPDYQLLSTSEVAECLRISEGSVRKAARDGRLRFIDGFRVLYFTARAVRAFVHGNEAAPLRHPERRDGHDGRAPHEQDQTDMDRR
jgi:hypothetical protein